MHPDEETFLKEAGGDFFRAFGLDLPDFKVDFSCRKEIYSWFQKP